MEKLYTLRDACDILQIDPTTIRRWEKDGKIKCIRLQNRYRRVPESEINRILGRQSARKSCIYARVSSNDQKGDLVTQVKRLRDFSRESEVFSDIRSGMRFKRKDFLRLLDMIEDDAVSTIYITHKDRLARFGFDLMERICEIHGTEIIEIDNEEMLSANEELTRDLISIISSFSARLYGIRSLKTKKILEAVRE